VRTKDKNLVTYDLTITYRIKPKEAHLLVRDGLQEIYRDRVYPTVESVLRSELAELSSEELFSTDRRLEVAANALPKLAAAMSEYHVQPESVLIRAINLPPNYDEKLQDKQLLQQKELLEQSLKRVEDQGAITESLSAEITAAEKELQADWDKRLQEARSDNQVRIAAILAEAEIYDKRTRAEADASFEAMGAEGQLAIDRAEALRDELRNQALDTVGGRILLARQAAENLRFEHVTLNSNAEGVPTVLDVGGLVDLLIGR
jgi:regulator of protease activity HflC (stomatin/prohibitin superfamily)